MKRVLVTGGSYGIGEAVVKALYKRGDEVVYFSRSEGMQKMTARWRYCDLEYTSSIDNALKLTNIDPDNPIQFDAVIHNAAIQDRMASQWNSASVEKHFRINALGPMYLTQRLFELNMMKRPCSMVILSSIAGELGHDSFVAYAMSKGALNAWTKSLVTKCQKQECDVHIRVMYPGRVNTPGNPRREVTDWNAYKEPEEIAEKILDVMDLKTDVVDGKIIDLGRR